MMIAELAATASCFTLAWIGLNALWETLGSHDSALFKSHVNQRLEREKQLELNRRWRLSHLLLFAGCGLGALMAIGAVIDLAQNACGHIKFVELSGLITAGGALMIAIPAWLSGRLTGLGPAKERIIWYAVALIVFLSLVAAIARENAIASLLASWVVGSLIATTQFVLVRAKRFMTSEPAIGASDSLTAIPAYRWRIILESMALFAALCIGFYPVENFRGGRAQEAMEEELAAAGIAPDWASLIPAAIPDEDNFFLALNPRVYIRNRGANPKSRAVMTPRKAEPLASLPVKTRKAFEPGPFYDLKAADRALISKGLAAATAVDPVGKWLRKNHAFFEPALQAANRSDSLYPVNRTAPQYEQTTPDYVALRATAQAFAIRAQHALERGDPAFALECLRVLRQLHRSMRSSPGLTSAMIGISIAEMEVQLIAEGIQRDQWSSSQLEIFQSQLISIDAIQLVKNSVAQEILALTKVLERCGMDLTYYGYASHKYPSLLYLPRGWGHRMTAQCINSSCKIFWPLIDASERRIHFEQFPQSAAREERIYASRSIFSLLGRLAFPAFRKAFTTTARIQSHINMTRIACALERRRMVHGGYPKNLEELVPEWLESLPHDIATGEPLIYRLEPGGGYIIYSRGENQKDDGGVIGSKEALSDWPWKRRPSAASTAEETTNQ